MTYFPVLEARVVERTRKMELMDLSEKVMEVPNERMEVKKIYAQNKVFDKILSLAYKYQEKGFVVTIVGKPVEEARREIGMNYSRKMAILTSD